MSMLFYLVFNSLCCYFIFLFHENADEEEGNYKNVYENDADHFDKDVYSEIEGHESAENQDICDWKDNSKILNRMSS